MPRTDLTPSDEAELAELVAEAAAARRGLMIRGGGTRAVERAVEGDVLSTRGLTGVTRYEPAALTLVVRAGTPLRDVEALLAGENQQLAFEPWDAPGVSGRNGVPTVGGMAAVNASGPRRIKAGACRDAMLGVRFVDGTGAVVKNGGRVMKNVTGLDLVKLMAGSHGTLGILTEVAFKVQPRPEVVASVVLDGLDLETAGAAMRAALATPYDVSGAAHLPKGFEGGSITLLRLEGFEASVAHRARELADVLSRFGPGRVLREDDAWTRVRNANGLGERPGALWRVSVKPTDGPRLARRLEEAEVVLDWGGGLLWVRAAEDFDLRAAMGDIRGHATLVTASPDAFSRWPVLPPEPAPVATLSAGLRARFDPAEILNPGLMAARDPVAA